MWPCCVRTVPQGPDLKLELAEELLASMARCCRHPVSPLEDKGMRRLLCIVCVFVNLVVIWYAIGCQTIPLVKVKPIFQIHLASHVYPVLFLIVGVLFVLLSGAA